jgi:hypothetical protein
VWSRGVGGGNAGSGGAACAARLLGLLVLAITRRSFDL